MKKILLFFSAMCCMMVANAQVFIENDIKYNVTSTDNKTVEVVSNTENTYSGDVEIPATVTHEEETYSVTSIGDKAFYNCGNLTSVTIPSTVTSIGIDAFCYCGNLTSIAIPSSVSSIGDAAFYDCGKLTSVTLSNSLESIGNSVFKYCENLTSITIPSTVTSIGHSAFEDCDNLTSITIPSSVTSIGDEAFYDCDNLTSVTLSNSLESIGNSVFKYCDKLTSITIPSTVTSIGYSAFEGCENLTSITIPKNVASIGVSTFSGCSLLSSICVEEGNKTYDSRDNCNAIIETATNTLIAGCNNTVILSSVTTIGNYAFYYLENLKKINIPGSVTSIGKSAFAYCDNLVSVTLTKGLVSIGELAFDSCTKLTSITIPSTVTSIGDFAFFLCTGLKSIKVSASTPPLLLDDDVFSHVDKSISVYVPDVKAYSDVSWGGFTNFIAINIDKIKQDAIDEINVAKEGVSLTDEEKADLNTCIEKINGVTELSDEDLKIIEESKNVALDIISLAILRSIRLAALAEIDAAKEGVSLTDEEKADLNICIEKINGVTILSDKNLKIIEESKNAALDIISRAQIRNARETALATIEVAMQGETSAYLTSLVQQYIDTINDATDIPTINQARDTAVAVLNETMPTYKTIKAEGIEEGKSETLGTLGIEQEGPALEVIDQDDKVLKLYNPKKVNFTKE
ncbi:MAG: leucine-rich repeat protein [Bacteroidaceae bacterium]|nr:leucine-rich repeat protein [Bacteroidaceae bacterium]